MNSLAMLLRRAVVAFFRLMSTGAASAIALQGHKDHLNEYSISG